MTYNLAALLSFLVAFQLFFVSLYLFTNKKGNVRNNRLLGLVFLMFSISLVDFTIRVSGVLLPIPFVHLIDDGFFFLYGPVLYFYTQGVVYRDFKLKSASLIHIIPYALFSGYLLYQLIFIDLSSQKEVTGKIVTADLPTWFFLASFFIYLHILVYLGMAWKTIIKYRSVIKSKFSTIHEINLDWLNFMIKAFATITVIAMSHNMMPVFGSVFMHYASVIVLLIVSFLFINRVLVKALNQPEIFSGISTEETEKYATSTLKAEALETYKEQIIRLMEDQKIYLSPELTSQELATKLNTSPKVLSQVINQSFRKNFFDFVNTYRCQEVKEILQGPDKKITIIEAMYKSGFNSKSSFNKEFKKLTGQTPSEFKKSI